MLIENWKYARLAALGAGSLLSISAFVVGCGADKPCDAGGACEASNAGSGSDASADAARDAGVAREGGSGEGGGVIDGSGPPEITTPNETAGTRLRPIYQRIKSTDGAELRTFTGMRDTFRGDVCGPKLLADGKYHCAPSGERVDITPDTHFLDATCTRPVIGMMKQVGPDRCPNELYPRSTKRYLTLEASTACGQSHILPLPTTPPLAVSTLYYKSGTSCTAYDLQGGGQSYTYELYAAPQPLVDVAPSDFVTLTPSEVTLPGSSRLRALMTSYAADDGARWTAIGRLVDSVRNEYCDLASASDGSKRCLPAGADVRDFNLADATCSKPAYNVLERSSCTSDPRATSASYMKEPTRGLSCGQTTVYPRFPSSSQISRTYYSSDAQCIAMDVTNGDGINYYSGPLPPPLAPSLFEPLTFSWESATQRVYNVSSTKLGFKAYTFGSPDGFHVSYSYFSAWDTGRNNACYPYTLNDGKVYCVVAERPLSFGSNSQSYYSDATCTAQVFGVDNGAAGCGAPAGDTYLDRVSSATSCDAYRVVRTTSPAMYLPKVYSMASGVCASAEISPEYYRFYRKNDFQEIPPSAFTQVTIDLLEAP